MTSSVKLESKTNTLADRIRTKRLQRRLRTFTDAEKSTDTSEATHEHLYYFQRQSYTDKLYFATRAVRLLHGATVVHDDSNYLNICVCVCVWESIANTLYWV